MNQQQHHNTQNHARTTNTVYSNISLFRSHHCMKFEYHSQKFKHILSSRLFLSKYNIIRVCRHLAVRFPLFTPNTVLAFAKRTADMRCHIHGMAFDLRSNMCLFGPLSFVLFSLCRLWLMCACFFFVVTSLPYYHFVCSVCMALAISLSFVGLRSLVLFCYAFIQCCLIAFNNSSDEIVQRFRPRICIEMVLAISKEAHDKPNSLLQTSSFLVFFPFYLSVIAFL